MNKIIIILVSTLFMSGCGLFETRVEYRDKLVPIYTVPAPPEIERPELPIHSTKYQSPAFLANDNNIGQIAQDYTISLRLSLNYSLAQEEIIETYRRLSKRDFANDSILRSMKNFEDGDVPMTFSSTGINSLESEVLINQVQFESYARSAFSDIIHKYEKNKEEILKNEIK